MICGIVTALNGNRIVSGCIKGAVRHRDIFDFLGIDPLVTICKCAVVDCQAADFFIVEFIIIAQRLIAACRIVDVEVAVLKGNAVDGSFLQRRCDVDFCGKGQPIKGDVAPVLRKVVAADSAFSFGIQYIVGDRSAGRTIDMPRQSQRRRRPLP